ncbi:NAD(P)-binding protein [Gonapodya prolifera JEL478]|uniref:NAD(P)-binding protein n=1 Tax=Gonapodya prolifera (strain JEL478) TaxID=1344416 RepID=A0A139A683_GONPJ|nr:NAD(P)-binding protein [Gonapodya prolifera JEL478]|eukprot:KXS12330.1 NAD(P)-binding protein [Gonapodya prolifera JEL478]
MESPPALPYITPTRGIVLVTGASVRLIPILCRSSHFDSNLTTGTFTARFLPSIVAIARMAHICLLLLRQKFSVRACVRSASKATSLLHHISLTLQTVPLAGPDGNYWQGTDVTGRWDTVVVPDMAAPACYDDEMVRCVAAVHVASPLSTSKAYADSEAELARPIVQGTLNILSAAHRTPTCRIVVVTSTFGTALRTRQALPYTFSETDWNTQSRVDDGGIESYRAAKTRAEKVAWRFVKENEAKFELVTLCPPQIIGPLIHDPSAWEFSLTNIHTILSNPWESASATGGAGFVDVRDVAEAHVRAVEMGVSGESPWRAGTSSGRTAVEGKERQKDEFPSSTPSAPPDAKMSAPVFGIDNAKSKAVLGMRYRSFEESVRESLEQYAELVQTRNYSTTAGV